MSIPARHYATFRQDYDLARQGVVVQMNPVDPADGAVVLAAHVLDLRNFVIPRRCLLGFVLVRPEVKVEFYSARLLPATTAEVHRVNDDDDDDDGGGGGGGIGSSGDGVAGGGGGDGSVNSGDGSLSLLEASHDEPSCVTSSTPNRRRDGEPAQSSTPKPYRACLPRRQLLQLLRD